MPLNFIKVLTLNGYISLNKTSIISIDKVDEGTQIVLFTSPYSDEPITINSVESYETILETYFAG